jgi:hypothetical protein
MNEARAVCHPYACDKGMIKAEPSAPPAPIANAYAPVTEAVLPEKSRLIRLGSNTLPKAMPTPIMAVPQYSSHIAPDERNAIPSATSASAPTIVRSSPSLRATAELTGEKAANASNGSDESTPTADVLRLKSFRTKASTGASQ